MLVSHLPRPTAPAIPLGTLQTTRLDPSPACSLADMPPEMLLMIASWLPTRADMSAFAQVNCQTYRAVSFDVQAMHVAELMSTIQRSFKTRDMATATRRVLEFMSRPGAGLARDEKVLWALDKMLKYFGVRMNLCATEIDDAGQTLNSLTAIQHLLRRDRRTPLGNRLLNQLETRAADIAQARYLKNKSNGYLFDTTLFHRHPA